MRKGVMRRLICARSAFTMLSGQGGSFTTAGLLGP